MRKFATPIGSSQYPANGITLSLTQIPISIQTPEAVTECPQCSFDNLIFIVNNYDGVKVGNIVKNIYPTNEMVAIAVVGSNLNSADVVWNITFQLLDPNNSPTILYSTGFVAAVKLNYLMANDDKIFATATVCDKSITAALWTFGGA